MPSTRETALASLAATLGAAVAPIDLERNEPRPQDLSNRRNQSLLILGDGEPGEPEQTFGVKTYWWVHLVELEIMVQRASNDARAAEIDDLAAAVGAAITADTTLGGTVRYAQPSGVTPAHDQDDAGTVPYGVGLMTIRLQYETDTPTG